eukprot:m.190630 g.190630  ORF g.190630 m.190630 type:complete len:2988 (-) comp13640_c0_seq2:214-9177(-)
MQPTTTSTTLVLVVIVGLFLNSFASATCPSDSNVLDSTSCVCPVGSSCSSTDTTQCSINLDDLHVFPQSCADCTCVLDAIVHHIALPTYGTICVVGSDCPIQWAANAAVESVDIFLFKATGATSNKKVATIANSANNTGSFKWTVEDIAPTGDTYFVAIVATNNQFSFVKSPLFTLLNNPNGTPCPIGYASATDAYPSCRPCAQGTYANADNTACVRCSNGWTTSGTASQNSSLCNVDKKSILASFSRHKGRYIVEQDLAMLSSITLDRCAFFCITDMTCKSFDFLWTSATAGKCYLSADNAQTALTNTFVFSEDQPFHHYSRRDDIGKASVSSGFSRSASTFLSVTPAVTVSADVSLEACLVLCVRDSDCKAAAYGTGVRIGECFLYDKNTTDVDSNQIVTEAAHQLDLYEKVLSSPLCEEGYASPTSTGQCIPCPRNSYGSITPPYACSPCTGALITKQVASTSADQCVELKCNNGDSPDSDGGCKCPTGSQCIGYLCDTTSSGVPFYPATCQNCSCTTPRQPPTIDFIFTPITGDTLYYGQTVEVLYQASNSVRYIALLLYEKHPTLDGYVSYVGTIVRYALNTGSFKWTVPNSVSAGDEYVIVIIHDALSGETSAPTHRNSGYFSIKAPPTGPCAEGSFNADTGAFPCTLCPIGTYWMDSKTCADCPANTTTFNPGSLSLQDCSILADHALYQFEKMPHTYFPGSNAAGYFLEDDDHLTVEQCARKCLDDAGCKAFDAGDPTLFQAGDCFLSYDNIDTIGEANVRAISQLDLYIRKNIDPILSSQFTRTQHAYIEERDDGGVYLEAYTPESCAQLCINDVCCKSFDAGRAGTSKELDCYLSFSNRGDVDTSDFISTDSTPYDYYEKKLAVYMQFNASISLVENSPTQLGSFKSILLSTLAGETIVDENDISITSVSGTDDGYIQVNVVVEDNDVQTEIEQAINDNSIKIVFPPLIGNTYFATFSSSSGPCFRGSVSQTGDKDRTCSTCRANTYTNLAQTICFGCESGSTSSPGSYSPTQCKVPSDEVHSFFAVGDEWLGTFSSLCAASDGTKKTCTGRVDFEFLQVSTENIRVKAQFIHGEYCNTAAGCRIESAGISEFYYDGTASGNQISLTYDPYTWGGITDRTWVRENIVATISHAEDGSLVLSGNYGSSGSIDVQKLCGVNFNPSTFSVGDKWVGSYTCDPRDSSSTSYADVFRIEMLVDEVNDIKGTTTAVVDFDHYQGIGQYVAHTAFDSGSKCYAVDFIPQKWITTHPADVQARQLSGRLTDTGEHFGGQFGLNQHCECNGMVSDTVSNRGGSCDAWDGTDRWCYVDEKCPSAVRDDEFQNLFRAPCGVFPDCGDFYLTRICPVEQPGCEIGYKRHNNRCYKVMTDALPFANASATCEAVGGHLPSVHSSTENAFLAKLLSDANVTAKAWLGAKRGGDEESFSWEDGTPFIPSADSSVFVSFDAWGELSPSSPSNNTRSSCALLNNQNGDWSDNSCMVPHPFVCKKPSPATNSSCSCTGEEDADGFGSKCNEWGGAFSSDIQWCYTSQHCPRAVPHPTNAKKFVRTCVTPALDTTTAATTTTQTTTTTLSCHALDASMYTRDDGMCAKCISTDDCGDGQVIVGECKEFSSPSCLNCDSSCATCSGLGPNNCDTCAAGRIWSFDRSQCVETCGIGFYPDQDMGICTACDLSCASCKDDASSNSCTACDPSSLSHNLFLSDDGIVGKCVSGCPSSYYVQSSSGKCTRCSVCDVNEYLSSPCSTSADAECSVVSSCDDDEYELAAPTATTNRMCKAVSSCSRGAYQTQAPSDTSDRQCRPCPEGTTDSRNSSSVSVLKACFTCDPGTYTSTGNVGACPMCNAGTADDDMDPSTPCVECENGITYSEESGSTTCDDVTTCQKGEEEAVKPTQTRNRICVTCSDGTFKSESGQNAKCVPWTTCPAGKQPVLSTTPSATQDRECESCPQGSFKAQEGNFNCEPAFVCESKEVETQPPSATSDRKCSACPSSSYFDEDQTKCIPVSSCKDDEYISQPATDVSNVICAPLTSCLDTEFVSVPAGRNNNRVCEPLTVCSALEFQSRVPQESNVTPGLFIADRQCSNCTLTCPAGRSIQNPCNSTSDTVCTGCTPCGSNEFEIQPCTTDTDRKCKACNQCDTTIQYQVSACSSFSDIVCNPLSTCDPITQYESEAPTAFSNRICKPLTQCGSPLVEIVAPTVTSDRVCDFCDVDTFYDSTEGKCLPVSVCPEGQQEKVPPTHVSNRICEDCLEFYFKSSPGQGKCRPVTACVVGEVVVSPPTLTSDRVCYRCNITANEYSTNPQSTNCSPATTCSPGTHVIQPLTSFQNRKCELCSDGSFTDMENQDECTVASLCPVGHGSIVAPTLSTDRVCVPCISGTSYSESESTDACAPTTDCPVGYEVQTPATSSSDRICRKCASGFDFKDTIGQDDCQAVSLCGVGEEPVTSPTFTSDRICGSCPAGTFKDVEGISLCKEHAPSCGAGTRQDGVPSSTEDRQCVPCRVEDEMYQDLAGANTCKTLAKCEPGSYVSVIATSLRNRECTRCGAGSYSNSDNAPSCTTCEAGKYQPSVGQVLCAPVSVCDVGSYTRVAATKTSDAECTLCNGKDEFQDRPGMNTCKSTQVCTGLYDEFVPPTSSSDRVCGCKEGVSFSADGLTNCVAVFECGSGGVEFFEPTTTSDRICVQRSDIGDLELRFENDFEDVNGDNYEGEFLSLLFGALSARLGVNSTVLFKGSLSRGSIYADLETSDKTVVSDLRDDATNGDISFYWNVTDKTYVALPAGACPRGDVSETGEYPGCTPCQRNHYANSGQQMCLPCPEDQISPIGSSSAADCFADPSIDSSTSGTASSTSLIAGIIAGVVVIVLVIIAVVWWTRRGNTVQKLELSPSSALDERQSFQNPLYDTSGRDSIDFAADEDNYAQPDVSDGYDDVNPDYDTIHGHNGGVNNPLYGAADDFGVHDDDDDSDYDDVHHTGYLDVGGLDNEDEA